MTFTEAKEVFINRGWIDVKGGRVFDGNKWREACVVISEWLEREPCEDCISRRVVIDTVERWLEYSGYNEAERHIMMAVRSVLYDLPPVTPQPKIGHWIYKTIRGEKVPCCSRCGLDSGTYYEFNLCPNCGAKMIEEPQESEE